MLTEDEYAVLKISGEPYQYFTESDVHARLTRSPIDYYNFVKTGLLGLARGESTLEMPAKLIFTDSGSLGDFRVMPCVIHGAHRTLKTVKLVGTNIRQQQVRQQITVGKSFIIDNDENFISHIFEACLLSSARTAICACIAIEYLAASGRKMSLIGAGRVGYYCGYYALALGLIDEIRISDIDTGQAQRLAEIFRSNFSDKKITVVAYAELDATDILVLATTSRTAIYHPDHFQAGLVVSLGADIDFQHELSPQLARAARIFVDTLDSARYGDLKFWTQEGLVTLSGITDLMELLRQDGVVKGPERRVFVSTGTALFDNLTMGYLVHDDSNKNT